MFNFLGFSKNDLIGKCQIPLSKISQGKNDLWLPLGQVNNAFPQIHVVLEIEPKIMITLIEGKDLPSMDIGGTSDPFVEFVLDKEKKKSNVIKKNLNPKWNEHFDFQVHNMNDVLYLNVFDWNLLLSNTLIGQGVVSLSSLNLGKNDLWIPLPKKGSIHLEVEAIGFGKVQQLFNQQFNTQSFNTQQQFNPYQQQFNTQQQFNNQQQFSQQEINQQQFNTQQSFNPQQQFNTQQINTQQQFNQQGINQQQFITQQSFNPQQQFSQQGMNTSQQFNSQQSFNPQFISQQSLNMQGSFNPQQQFSQQGLNTSQQFNSQQSFNPQQINPQQSFNQQQPQKSFNQQQQQIVIQQTQNLPVVDFFIYADHIYGFHQSKSIKLSKEKGWEKMNFATFINGKIYSISQATGHIVEWDATTGIHKSINTEDWSSAKAMCENKGYLYVVSMDIYRIDPRNGNSQKITRDSDWDETAYECICPYGDELITINEDDGMVYGVNIHNGKWEVLSEDDWGEARGIHNVNGKIYIVDDYIWEFDPESGDSFEKSKEGQWNFTEHSTVHAGNILMLIKMEGGKIEINDWNPKNGSYRVIGSDDWDDACTIVSPFGTKTK